MFKKINRPKLKNMETHPSLDNPHEKEVETEQEKQKIQDYICGGNMDDVCETCGKIISNKLEIVTCQDCHSIPYCSENCRAADSDYHKNITKTCVACDQWNWDEVFEMFQGIKEGDIKCFQGTPILMLAGPITIAGSETPITNEKRELKSNEKEEEKKEIKPRERIPHALRHDDGRSEQTSLYKIYTGFYGDKASYYRNAQYYVIKLRDVPRVVNHQLSQRQRDEIKKIHMIETNRRLQAHSRMKAMQNGIGTIGSKPNMPLAPPVPTQSNESVEETPPPLEETDENKKLAAEKLKTIKEGPNIVDELITKSIESFQIAIDQNHNEEVTLKEA